jgi:glycosyltransferase involved in cell wall biosynthesis
MIHERFPERFPKNDMTSQMKAESVARADHVICISESTQRDLIEILGVEPTKTSVVHLGFALTQQRPFESTSYDRPYLLYVGQRSGYKNFESLLIAYSSSHELMSNYDLLVFGGGNWTDSELGRASCLGIDVSRLRNIQGNDCALANLYQNASLLIYPSIYEGFGIPPLEAMSFGCPVVSSNTSSIPEVVGEAAELFDPYSPSAMLIAIERVLGSSRHRQALVDRGYTRIKKFSWDRCAEQTAEIYRSIV